MVNLNAVVIMQHRENDKWATMLQVLPYHQIRENSAAGRYIFTKHAGINCVPVANIVTLATIAKTPDGQFVYLKAKIPHVLPKTLPHVCVSVSPKIGDICLLAVSESDHVAQAVTQHQEELRVRPAVIGAIDKTSKIFGVCIQEARGHHRFDRAKFCLWKEMDDLSEDCKTRLRRREIKKILIPYRHFSHGMHKREMLIHLGCVLDRVHAAPKKVTDVAGIPREHIAILQFNPKRCIEEVVLRSQTVDELNDKQWVSHLLKERLDQQVLNRVRQFISCLSDDEEGD